MLSFVERHDLGAERAEPRRVLRGPEARSRRHFAFLHVAVGEVVEDRDPGNVVERVLRARLGEAADASVGNRDSLSEARRAELLARRQAVDDGLPRQPEVGFEQRAPFRERVHATVSVAIERRASMKSLPPALNRSASNFQPNGVVIHWWNSSFRQSLMWRMVSPNIESFNVGSDILHLERSFDTGLVPRLGASDQDILSVRGAKQPPPVACADADAIGRIDVTVAPPASAPRVKLFYGWLVGIMGVWRIDQPRDWSCVTATKRGWPS